MLPPSEGRRLGRYVLDTQIGMGGMGVVYAATDTHMNRVVALKVLSGQHAASADFRQRFQREADTLARLDSPHIVTIFDHGEEEGLPYLATQYVRGGDLGFLLRERGALPPASAIMVCSQVAEALQDAHEAGVVHRDIKPSNVLLRDPDAPRLHAYLCDFGIAQDEGTEGSERLTTAGGVVGTWAYLAPERSDGAPASRVSDVYSLGCLLWVALTGEAPYTGTDVGVAMAHVNAPVRRLAGDQPHVAHLNEVLAGAMAKDPAQRYPSADSFHRALNQTPAVTAPVVAAPLSSRPRPASPPPSHPPVQAPAAPPPGGRRRALLLVLVCALVLVVGGVVALVVTGGDDADRVVDDSPTPASSESPTAPAPGPGPGPPGAVRTDLDGDGAGDAIATLEQDYTGKATRYTLTSEGDAFEVASRTVDQYAYPIYVDWDGNGTLDAIEPVPVGDEGELELRSDDPTLDGTTYDGIGLEETAFFVDARAGDFTGDERPDLLLFGQSGPRTLTVWVLENTGTGFAEPQVWTTLEEEHVYTTQLYSGDFDDDGLEDVAAKLPVGAPEFDGRGGATHDGAYSLTLLASTGSGLAESGEPAEDPVLETASIVTGDFTGDGTPRLAISNTDEATGTVRVFTFGPEGLTEEPGWEFSVAPDSDRPGSVRTMVSDVDGDRRDDLVFTKQLTDTTFLDFGVAISDGVDFDVQQDWARSPTCEPDLDLCLLYFAAAF